MFLVWFGPFFLSHTLLSKNPPFIKSDQKMILLGTVFSEH